MENDLDNLTCSLGNSLQIDGDSLGEHPRYSLYKNYAKASEQQAKRREEALERQRNARCERLDRIRRIVEVEEEGDIDDMNIMETRRLYDGAIMTSEWLVDIPDEFTHKWISLMVPIGKRVLVVANRNKTKVYNKGGRLLKTLDTRLPGGSKGGGGGGKCRGHSCMLDCIVNMDKLQFYVIDVIQWNDTTFYESPFDLRRFFLNGRMEENSQLSIPSSKFKSSFHSLPSSSASPLDISAMMSSPINFDVDGLLFYHPEVLYSAGQSPLVGWLKPWMLPEILNVHIPDKFTSGAPSSALNFIELFNKEHNHTSIAKKV